MASEDQQREDKRRWMEAWRLAGPELERIRRQEIESADTAKAIRILFGDAPPPQTPRPISGLVEQQRWFSLLRERQGK